MDALHHSKEKIKKNDFATKLVQMFGLEALSQCAHTERGYGSMTLYYVNGAHAATWQQGQGVIFKSAIVKVG